MRCYVLTLRCLRTNCCLIVVILVAILIIGRLYQYRRTLTHRASNNYVDIEQLIFSQVPTTKERFVPGRFLNDLKPSNVSFCNFRYSLPHSLDISENDVQLSPELGISSEYRVVYNVLYPSVSLNSINVTYCTHATPEFLYYLPEILQRWHGPVSLAMFVPHTDATLSVCLLERLCSCLPDMSRVSVHFVFPLAFPPELEECSEIFQSSNSCSSPDLLANGELQTFRYTESLKYPINVARNVARIKAETFFVLVSDVELFPSKNLVPNFLKMVELNRQKNGMEIELFMKNLVFVLPVFEVQSHESVPDVKSKLLELYSRNRAFYFHRWVCSHCQRFPGLQRWLLKRKKSLDNSIEPFFAVRREFPFHRWEPVFIGTNAEPLYSELLSWEGLQDKMTQMHEMCLLKYRFVILDGAFLVHSPGVKRKSDIVQNSWRTQLQKENSYHYDQVISQITSKQKPNPRCKVH